MKTLPEAASLDHLRRQAKDLLAELRRSAPRTTLATAQAALAEQYGYADWASMKAEVERRANGTGRQAEPDLARAVADAFGLGGVDGPMRPIERRWAGWVWSLPTTDGRFAVTNLFDHVNGDALEVEVGLVEAAITAGIDALVPRRTIQGSVVAVVDVDGTRWRAHEWRPLGPAPSTPPPLATAAAAGRMLATLHALALPAPGPVPNWLTHRRPAQDWEALVAFARDASAAWADDLARAVPGFVALDAIRDERDPVERAILSHGSAGPVQTRVAGGDRLVLVDWENACATPPDWELGAALTTWSARLDGGYDEAVARALLDAYQTACGRTITVDLSMFHSAVCAHLNWTATRIGIALFSDDDERREVAAREVPQLLARPMTSARIAGLAEALSSPAVSGRR